MSASTQLERLAQGLTILAAHDPNAPLDMWLYLAIEVSKPVDYAADTALRALGWNYNNAGRCWEFES